MQQEAYREAFSEITNEINSTKRSISDLSETIQTIGTQFARAIREIAELAEEQAK